MGYSERIKQIRTLFQINQSELANKMGVSRSIVSEFENGAREPSKDFLLSLHALGVSLDWFLTGSGEILNEDRLTSKLFDGKNHPSKSLDISLQKPIENNAEKKGQEDDLLTEIISHQKTDLLANRKTDFIKLRETIDVGLIIPFLDQPVSAGSGKDLSSDSEPSRFLTVPPELAKYTNISALPVRGDSMSPTLHEGDLVVCDSGGWDGDGVYVIKTAESAFVKRVVQTSKGYTVISDNKAYPAYSESKEDMLIVGRVRCAVVRLE